MVFVTIPKAVWLPSCQSLSVTMCEGMSYRGRRERGCCDIMKLFTVRTSLLGTLRVEVLGGSVLSAHISQHLPLS